MISWILANPFTILMIVIISLGLIYGFFRVMSFGIVKSFYKRNLCYEAFEYF